jgi:hypothetical protein
MSEQIVIPQDRYTQGIRAFVEDTALGACCTVGIDMVGAAPALVVRADYPVAVWSTGERHLWAFLYSVTHGPVRELLDTADQATLSALVDMFAALAYDNEAAS